MDPKKEIEKLTARIKSVEDRFFDGGIDESTYKGTTKRYGEDTATYPPEIETLFDRARQDWARFNSEPNWLLSELRN